MLTGSRLLIIFIFWLALSRFLGNMAESRCMTPPPVLTPITGEVEPPPFQDTSEYSPPLSPIDEDVLDIKKDFTTFLVSFLIFYLLLFSFKHPIFQDAKGRIAYQKKNGFYRHYKMRRFWRDASGKQNKNSEKSLLLCALAYRFPDNSNSDILELLGEQQKVNCGQIVKLRSQKTGPGHNTNLFESAADLAEVGQIQVLVVKTSKVFKFHQDSYKNNKVMQVHCESDTVKHPSYSLQLDGHFAEWCVSRCIVPILCNQCIFCRNSDKQWIFCENSTGSTYRVVISNKCLLEFHRWNMW